MNAFASRVREAVWMEGGILQLISFWAATTGMFGIWMFMYNIRDFWAQNAAIGIMNPIFLLILGYFWVKALIETGQIVNDCLEEMS